MRKFDQTRIAENLKALSVEAATVFAASCATRALAGYVRYANEIDDSDLREVQKLRDRLWGRLARKSFPEGLTAWIELCEELIPDEGDDDDEEWSVTQALAEDAIDALNYAIRVLAHSSQADAAYAARCAFEALDQWVNDRDQVDPNDQAAADRILANPTIQRELERQERDLAELQHTAGDLTAELVSQFRERARAEAESFLD